MIESTPRRVISVGPALQLSNAETENRAACGTTDACPRPRDSPHRKSPRRDVARILQSEKKTLQTGIGFEVPR
jgi:hypothetical protein